jgi:hypothetical protein
VTYARPGRAGTIEPRGGAEPGPRGQRSTFARLIGAIGLVLLTSLLFWMLTDDAFRVTDASVSFEGLAHADEEVVREHLPDIERGPNVFRVKASQIVSELSTLTAVDAAAARLNLPAGLIVELDERDPVFIWSNGARSWLVDEEGMLFAPADEATAAAVRAAALEVGTTDEGAADQEEAGVTIPGETAEGEAVAPELTLMARANLPLVEDARLPAEQPTVGSHLGATDLQVMRQLLALTPELLGSRATSLELRVDASDGYVLKSDLGWQALFGTYTPTLQPPTVIPLQVQCLQWLLAKEERKLEQVWLAISDEACGTYSLIK